MMKGLPFANIPEQSELFWRSGRTSGLESIGMNRFRSVAELSSLSHPKRKRQLYNSYLLVAGIMMTGDIIPTTLVGGASSQSHLQVGDI